MLTVLRCFCVVFLPYQPIHDFGQGVYLLPVQLFQILHQPAYRLRVGIAIFKKFLRRNVEVFADIEEVRHSRKCFSVLNAVDISMILPQRQTHISGRNAFLYSQLRQPPGKHLFVQPCHHPFCHIVSDSTANFGTFYIPFLLLYQFISAIIQLATEFIRDYKEELGYDY